MSFAKYETRRSKAYNDRLKKVVPGGMHYSFRMPWESKHIHFVRGSGARAWDLDGNEYLDFFSKFGANILGHNDPRYNASLTAALNGAPAMNLGTTETEAAEMICAFVPSAEMVRFSLSGTEAVQNAIRLARAYTGKNRFIRFFTHYHGNADNVLGGRVGDLTHPIAEDFAGDFNATDGKANGAAQESFLLPWNDAQVLDSVLTTYGAEVAAVLMEPICINGGGVVPDPGYLHEVRRLCDKHGVVLIFDEVITGFRVGLGGAQRLFGVTPDLTTLGKAIAGGALPVSAIVGKKDIMKLYEARKVVHGGTFNGFPLGMAAVKATLEILSENDGRCYGLMAATMREIHSSFVAAAARHGVEFEIRGVDSAAVYHAVAKDEGPTRQMADQFAVKLTSEAMAEHGVLVSNLNRFYGSIAVNADDVALFEERIEQVFERVGPFLEKMRSHEVHGNRASLTETSRAI
ncbi:MAG TPA: aminotransferase class III-fold pyridoxal phosphate-dependent enzyme [Vicinamibacterales bacterium]|nr:aminotransferase class III-fold pyridoxal phosphate-dependent enzyme [Vicinamibacterales bacterium]